MGVDLDPTEDMQVDIKDNGDCEVKYKGGKMDYDHYIDELEERANNKQKGKSISARAIGLFSGVSFDKKGNIIKN